MISDLANLLRFFLRFFVVGGALIITAWWLLGLIAESPILPVLAGAIPVSLMFWAIWPKR